MLIKVFGSAVFGIEATTVTIEVNMTQGINFMLVGLPDSAVKEGQQRIDSALQQYGYRIPGKKIIINMAPADIRKEGSAYDLPLAIGILAASEQIYTEDLEKYLIMGELSLDGTIQPIKGALPMVLQAKAEGFTRCILPTVNAKEASVVNDMEIFGADSLIQVINLLQNEASDTALRMKIDIDEAFSHVTEYDADFSDVKGQDNVKRALEIAAAGGHNVLMIGAPGSGKTMLAKRLPSILPPLTIEEALETTKIHSVAGKTGKETTLITKRPFRSPHHTISDVALVGGGSFPQPGEISLAHNGILFLDELPEFKRTVLEVMRQPLEDRVISVSRARFAVEYPASFMLIASMNPCPCGFYNHPDKNCMCPPGSVQKYLNRISGPLLDRIDLHIEVVPVPFEKLSEYKTAESSAVVRARVTEARKIQQKRFADIPGIHCNAQMDARLLKQYCRINEDGLNIMKLAMEKLGLSARAYDRILKVSRTIADLDNSEDIQASHLGEAIQYRSLDRDGWGA